MIVLLGASGYVGQALARELQRRGASFLPLSRAGLDYTKFEILWTFLREKKPELVINAAGFTGKPNVDACETAQADTLQGNTLLALTVAQACLAASVPYGHVSSGCIYSGAHVKVGGQWRVEKDLSQPALKRLAESQADCIRGFAESDEPNFSFRHPPCSFYSGTKALAEEALLKLGSGYLWRLRIPFDAIDNPRNYLTKVQRYPKVYDNVNSLSHREDFARACVDLWERRAPFGTYNVTNPGFVTTRQVVGLIQQVLKPGRAFEFWANDEEFYRVAAKTPRSNCVLDTTKLLDAGVKMRPVDEALIASLKDWRAA